MAMPFEQWAKAEIKRLRDESDALQLTLDMYLKANKLVGQPAEAGIVPSPASEVGMNGQAPKRVSRRKMGRPHGGKTKFVLDQIKAAGTTGATTGEIFDMSERQNMNIARSSLRSMLWHAKDVGQIAERGGRYYSKQEEPSASTPGSPVV